MVSRPYKYDIMVAPQYWAFEGVYTGPTQAQKEAIAKKFPNLKSGEAISANKDSKSDPNSPFKTVRTSSPNDCDNCNANDWNCELMKVGCEIQKGDWTKYLPYILAIAGALVAVMILK